MHTLNSIAGIRKYRIQDEMPDGFGCGMMGIPQDTGASNQYPEHEPSEKLEGLISTTCSSIGRIASRLYSRLH